jgi:pSer/pThr/pTyr-binding forkhead associated (FHA) protein
VHALLLLDGEGGFRLRDAGSSNGVAINGRRLAKDETAPLAPRDVVAFGDVALLFLDGPAFFDALPILVGA